MAKPNGNNGHKLAVCKPAPVGRPTKLTPEVQGLVCEAIGEGATRQIAAAYAGIGASTLQSWLAAGAGEESGPYLEFLEAVKKAEAANALKHLRKLEKAADTVWQASAWMLERRYRDDYGRSVVEHEGTIKHEHDLGPGIKELLVRLRAMRDRGTIDAVSG